MEVKIFNNTLLTLLLFLITLLISSFLIDEIVTILYLLMIILIISFIYSITIIKKANIELLKGIMKKCFILSLTILSTLIIAIVLPYLFYHNLSLNIYIIQYTYLFPLIIIFFLLFKIYFHVFNNIKINYKKILFRSISYALIISLIFSLLLIILLNQQYNKHDGLFKSSLERLKQQEDIEFHEDIEIYKEIKEYELELNNELNQEIYRFSNFDNNKNFCIIKNCEKIIFEKIFTINKFTIYQTIIKSYYEIIEEEYNFITSDEFYENFNSLDEYKFLLENKFDSNKEQKIVIDFNYSSNFEEICFSNCKKRSLLYTSLNHILINSRLYQEYIQSLKEISNYIDKTSNQNKLYTIIYNNKEIEENIESKIIRYKILLILNK
jgi:hypothetical protein